MNSPTNAGIAEHRSRGNGGERRLVHVTVLAVLSAAAAGICSPPRLGLDRGTCPQSLSSQTWGDVSLKSTEQALAAAQSGYGAWMQTHAEMKVMDVCRRVRRGQGKDGQACDAALALLRELEKAGFFDRVEAVWTTSEPEVVMALASRKSDVAARSAFANREMLTDILQVLGVASSLPTLAQEQSANRVSAALLLTPVLVRAQCDAPARDEESPVSFSTAVCDALAAGVRPLADALDAGGLVGPDLLLLHSRLRRLGVPNVIGQLSNALETRAIADLKDSANDLGGKGMDEVKSAISDYFGGVRKADAEASLSSSWNAIANAGRDLEATIGPYAKVVWVHDKVYNSMRAQRTEWLATQARLACAVFYAIYGTMPESPQQLAEAGLWELAKEPISGRVFSWENSKGEVKMYSWGADGRDDRGKSPPAELGPPDSALYRSAEFSGYDRVWLTRVR